MVLGDLGAAEAPLVGLTQGDLGTWTQLLQEGLRREKGASRSGRGQGKVQKDVEICLSEKRDDGIVC